MEQLFSEKIAIMAMPKASILEKNEAYKIAKSALDGEKSYINSSLENNLVINIIDREIELIKKRGFTNNNANVPNNSSQLTNADFIEFNFMLFGHHNLHHNLETIDLCLVNAQTNNLTISEMVIAELFIIMIQHYYKNLIHDYEIADKYNQLGRLANLELFKIERELIKVDELLNLLSDAQRKIRIGIKPDSFINIEKALIIPRLYPSCEQQLKDGGIDTKSLDKIYEISRGL